MDTRTGQIYESFEAAREAGVPEEFIAPVPHHAVDVTRECFKAPENPKYQPHEGARERERRARRLGKVA